MIDLTYEGIETEGNLTFNDSIASAPVIDLTYEGIETCQSLLF